MSLIAATGSSRPTWIRSAPVRLVPAVVLGVTGLVVIAFQSGDWLSPVAAIAPGILLLLTVLVLTAPARTVGTGAVALMLLTGIAVVTVAVLLIEGVLYVVFQHVDVTGPLHAVFGPSEQWDVPSVVFAPLVEELLKVLPIVVLLWRQPAARWLRGPADLAVLGAASGAGYGMAENLMKAAGGLDYGNPAVTALYVAPHLGPLSLDSELIRSPFGSVTSVFAGHGVGAMAICLAIGVALWLRPFALRWILPLFVTCWAIFDHLVFNYQGDLAAYASHCHCAASMPGWLSMLWIDGHGWVLPMLAMTGVVGVTIWSRRRVAAPSDAAAPRKLERPGRSGSVFPPSASGFLHWWELLRTRRAIAMASAKARRRQVSSQTAARVFDWMQIVATDAAMRSLQAVPATGGPPPPPARRADTPHAPAPPPLPSPPTVAEPQPPPVPGGS